MSGIRSIMKILQQERNSVLKWKMEIPKRDNAEKKKHYEAKSMPFL